jgi:small subunit ribosomal protein S6
MPLYDLMLLLDPGAPSDRHDAILKEVQGLLEAGGQIVTTQEWGTRRMTFEIDHRPEADYHLLQFETEKGGALLERVDHSLKIMDGVLRHRIIRQKDGNVPPPPPRAEGRYAEAPPVEGAPTDNGDGATSAGDAAAAPADVAAASETAPPTADPAADPVATDAAPAATEVAAPDASSLPPEEGQPAAAPAQAGTAAAGIPAAPSDAPAPAPAETPPPPDVDEQEAGPAGGGGDDEAPSGPPAG